MLIVLIVTSAVHLLTVNLKLHQILSSSLQYLIIVGLFQFGNSGGPLVNLVNKTFWI